MSGMEGLTIVVPMLNEEGAAQAVVTELFESFAQHGRELTVVCVNDGSTDGTQEILEVLEARHEGLICLRHGRREGYGAAIRSGLAIATTDLVGWMDGDGQYDPQDLLELLCQIDQGAVAAIGVRTERADPSHRRSLGRLGSSIAGRICGQRLADADAGLKVFDRRMVDLRNVRSHGSYISTEVLRRAVKSGDVAQVPISHRERRSGSQTGASPRVLGQLAVDYLRCVRT